VDRLVVQVLPFCAELWGPADAPLVVAGPVLVDPPAESPPLYRPTPQATEDNEIAGTPIPKGAIIALHMAAANRDPRRFDDPDRFLIARPAGKNLAFGHGIHFCLGAHLAGQEVRTAVGGLLPYLDRLELAGPLERNPTALLNGWQKVELAWT
jgi:cytochrome P450